MLPDIIEASIFSNIFGTSAAANTQQSIQRENQGANSQNISLLAANTTPLALAPKGSESKDQVSPVKADAEIKIDDNALSPTTNPLGVSDGTDKEISVDDMSVYVVRQGDTIAGIAKMFDVTPATIYGANDDLRKTRKLIPGDTLLILPINGIQYTVSKGDTLKGLAVKFKVSATDIADFNGLGAGAKLSLGDEIIIPDGELPVESDKPVSKPSTPSTKQKKVYAKNTKVVDGFVSPLPAGSFRKSQGFHDNNAVDLAAPKGTPIYAVAAGRVSLARNGYNGGFGNLVVIKHPNGIESLYAHQSQIVATTGQQVAQGELIGYVGTTGRSTGNHLHLEIHNAANPF